MIRESGSQSIFQSAFRPDVDGEVTELLTDEFIKVLEQYGLSIDESDIRPDESGFTVQLTSKRYGGDVTPETFQEIVDQLQECEYVESVYANTDNYSVVVETNLPVELY